MKRASGLLVFAGISMLLARSASAQWPEPKAPAIPEADGYVVIPKAAVPPDPKRMYRAIYNATFGADQPAHLLPALNMAGSELNAFAVAGVPSRNVKFLVVFHGDAINGILDDAHYKAKFGVANPNLNVLSEMRKQGLQLFVCGQNLVFAQIDPATISTDVKVASDALIVLMAYENDGYALLSF
jgi:intracellular sulfur oxidation DsrE/DsrF family protein